MYVGLVNQRRGDKMRSFAVRLVLIWGSWWGGGLQNVRSGEVALLGMGFG